MLTLPKLSIERNKDAEDALVEKTKQWLEAEGTERDPRIHASDLLDPRKAYWNRQHKEAMTPRMVGNFFVGKVLHAFFSTTMNDGKGLSLKDTDVGGTWDKELGISFSNDWEKPSKTKASPNGIPYELKTSRTVNEQSISDLSSYLEQLCIYMAAKKSLEGRLVVSRLMAKDAAKGYGTYPQYRAYEIRWTAKDLAAYRKQIKATAALLQKALTSKKPKDIKMLELCRSWKCGEGNCGHFSLCKPEGRYGSKGKWAK
jgi:hypothetical protein